LPNLCKTRSALISWKSGNHFGARLGLWVRSFIEPDVLKTKEPFDNTAQIYLINLHWKLGLGFQLRLRIALF